ncbi:hypothetical protein EXIGLDRAFT_199240 [Exidia glandulosa HHB12029]|uniref:Uncharacterized protein n=1 Tax=Exidia glandulosa HHB12029 TaxID=1314781 RepID=A0A165MY69_EXIGL|nr:hypothetical protein EXIGLDRAFT_199240 [Exidia glandulosa HHB12029]
MRGRTALVQVLTLGVTNADDATTTPLKHPPRALPAHATGARYVERARRARGTSVADTCIAQDSSCTWARVHKQLTAATHALPERELPVHDQPSQVKKTVNSAPGSTKHAMSYETSSTLPSSSV